jgi:molybdopterin molybdotransferase
MISVDEALALVRDRTESLPSQSFPLASALGLQLDEDVASQVDSPPFEKSMVDGYAIRLSDDSPTLHVTEMVTAGQVPQGRLERGKTIQVMTGAPVPEGTQAVVKWEDCRRLGEHSIANPSAGVADGHCVLPRGSSFRAGQVVLQAGKHIGPLDVALLAEIGQASIQAVPRPRAAVLATGDELVEVGSELAAGQIRNSNGPMLIAGLRDADVATVELGVARDDHDDLRARLSRGLECDALLVSGGVSAGVKDLVPSVWAELGVKQVFHKVRMKPGKPLWFGVCESDQRRRLVFGLPGNPVSTFVSFLLFVRPALRALAGWGFESTSSRPARLSSPLTHKGGRPTYHPCRCTFADDCDASRLLAEPLDWRGSADLATLTKANGLAVLPAGDYQLQSGAEVKIVSW